MRLIHVSVGNLPEVFSQDGGAIQRRVAELAVEQSRRGHSVHVFSPGVRSRSDSVHGVTVDYIPVRASGVAGRIEYQIRAARKGRHLNADVLHFHSEPESAAIWASSPAAKVLSYDYFTFRGGHLRPLYRKFLGAFDLLLPCSEYCARASSSYWALPDNRVQVVYNGVSLSQFFPDPSVAASERRLLGLSASDPLILYVGRTCRQKGTDVLLKAFESLRRSLPAASLVIVGPIERFGASDEGDPIALAWRDRIESSGAVYLGVVDEERLPRLYNAADVVCMPTTHLEMFGMAALEAQACGTPVVATNHGGLSEVVTADTGIRVPVGDAAALSGAFLKILTTPVLAAQLATNARAHARLFGWDRIVDGLDDVYQQAASFRGLN